MASVLLTRVDKFAAVLLVLMILAALCQPISEPALQFDREYIQQGEWWRLVTSQFIHYGHYHLLMNVAALAIVTFALWREAALTSYISVLMICLTGTGVGLWFSDPDLFYYAGLSGALHGLIAAGLILTLPQTPRINSLALLIVAGKVVWEHTPWFDVQHALLNAPVAVDAHLWGAVSGTLAGIATASCRRLKQYYP